MRLDAQKFQEMADDFATAARRYPGVMVRVHFDNATGAVVDRILGANPLPSGAVQVDLEAAGAELRRLAEAASPILAALGLGEGADVELQWLDTVFAVVPFDAEGLRGSAGVVEDVFRSSQAACQSIRNRALCYEGPAEHDMQPQGAAVPA